MAEESTRHICLILLCGIPASGKTSLAIQMKNYIAHSLHGNWHVLLLHYDQLIPSHLEKQLIAHSLEQGQSLWKSIRSQIITCVDYLLNHLAQTKCPLTYFPCDSQENLSDQSITFKDSSGDSTNLLCLTRPSDVDLALWDRFVFSICSSLKTTAISTDHAAGSWIVVIDDNMHYSSMRHMYCQLARKYEAGLCIIYVCCSLEEAQTRNRRREEGKVDEHVINAMHERFEAPDNTLRSWEKYSAIVDGTATVDFQPLVDLVFQALVDPQRPLPEEDTESKDVSRYVCSTNAIHQVDQILRRCVSKQMMEAKDAGCSKRELAVLSSHLVKLRTTILDRLKNGEIMLPIQDMKNAASDASKDENSLLFQFVQSLFVNRTSS